MLKKILQQANFFSRKFGYAAQAYKPQLATWKEITELQTQHKYSEAAQAAYNAIKKHPKEEGFYKKFFELLNTMGIYNFRQQIVDEVLLLHQEHFPINKPKP